MEYDEPTVTQEQQNKYVLLRKLSNCFHEKLETKRKRAIDTLMDNNISPAQKTKELEQFFEKRIDPDGFTVEIEGNHYSINLLEQLADELYNDQSFFYSDFDATIIDSLDFFKDSFSIDDEILAYHYYRLSKNDKALSILVWVLSIYICKSLRLEADTFYRIPVSSLSSQQECIALLEELIIIINDQLAQFIRDKKHFKIDAKITLEEEERNILLSDRIDIDAAYEIGKSLLEPSDLDMRHCSTEVLNLRPEEIELEQKRIEIQQIEYYLNKSIRSIYLLSSVIMEIGEEHFNPELIKIINSYKENAYQFLEDNYYRVVPTYLKIQEDLGITLQDEEDKSAKKRLSIIINQLLGYNSVEDILTNRISLLTDAAGWLEEPYRSKVEQNISKEIIGKTSQQKSISEYEDAVRQLFGDKALLLDDSTIITLATAELLYDEYAIKKPLEKFDYSGISALYYQSFESAYNQLIWKKIEKHYNGLLQEDGLCNIKTISLDFPPSSNKKQYNFNYFFHDKNTKCWSIKETCMYGAFDTLIKFILKSESDCKLCGILLNILNREYSETFQKKLQLFSNHIEKATQNRNTASHGQIVIDIKRCSEDKAEVVTEMRRENIGLITQLLDLFA